MIGGKRISLKTVDSTNTFIRANLANLSVGTVVTSEIQTAGKGRRDHIWVSEKGNLYMSFLLGDMFTYQTLFEEVCLISLTIVEVLRNHMIDASIKYPNDIVVGKKKIAGILVETVGSTALENVIVGVGLNVNQKQFNELSNKVTSMHLLTSKKTHVSRITNEVIEKYNHLEQLSSDAIYDAYKRYSIVIGKTIYYEGEEYLVTDISKTGDLYLNNIVDERIVSMNEVHLEELYDE